MPCAGREVQRRARFQDAILGLVAFADLGAEPSRVEVKRLVLALVVLQAQRFTATEDEEGKAYDVLA